MVFLDIPRPLRSSLDILAARPSQPTPQNQNKEQNIESRLTQANAWHAGIVGDDREALERGLVPQGIDQAGGDTAEAETTDEQGVTALDLGDGLRRGGQDLVDAIAGRGEGEVSSGGSEGAAKGQVAAEEGLANHDGSCARFRRLYSSSVSYGGGIPVLLSNIDKRGPFAQNTRGYHKKLEIPHTNTTKK